MLKNAEFHKKPEPHLIPVRVTSVRSRKCLFKGISEILFYPVLGFVRYLSAITDFVADTVIYAPFFSCPSSFFRKPKAKSIALETRACAFWNICEYVLSVVPELQCPKAPETVTTSSPAEIRAEAAKCRNECRP